METVSHEGAVFTKATVLAKKYRYTTDYIGQLCRAGKVESKLIGRAWFVNEESLLRHKSDRYTATRSSEITINKSVVSEKLVATGTPLRISPVLSKTTLRNLPNEHHVLIHHDTAVPAKIVTYHNDFEALEPFSHVKKTSNEMLYGKTGSKKSVAELPEISKNIPIILNEKAKNTLTFERIPEVSLQGNLPILSLDDPELFKDTKPVSVSEINFTPEAITKNAALETKLPVRTSKSTSVPIKHVTKQPHVQPKAFIPNGITKHSITVEKVLVAEPVKRVSFLAVPGFVLGAILLCVGLFSLSSFVESDGLQFRESLKFNVANVYEVAQKLPVSY